MKLRLFRINVVLAWLYIYLPEQKDFHVKSMGWGEWWDFVFALLACWVIAWDVERVIKQCFPSDSNRD